jgi:hypothetical protein
MYDRMDVRTLLVTFRHEGPIFPIGAFRGAVVEKVGRQHVFFHNHDEEGSSVYRYPLIQYKRFKGQPAFFCIGDGVDEIHKLFMQPNWDLDILGNRVRLQVDRLDLRTHPVRLNGQMHAYKLSDWQGLNRDNHARFHAAPNALQQKLMLERIVTGNLLSFAKGIGWQIEGRVLAEVPNPPLLKSRRFKGVEIDVFDMDIMTNMTLPEGMGIGKAVSLGFGVLENSEINQL